MFKVKQEMTKEALLECINMGAQNQYDEIIDRSSAISMKLDTNLIVKLLESGIINLVVARDAGNCIGYFCNLIDTDWLTSKKVGKELAIYVKPEYRKFGVFSAMLKLQEDINKKGGILVQMLEFQIGHNDEVPVGHGYKQISINYEKHLEAN